MTNFTRRDLMKCLAAGGAVVVGELWIPGQRLISIPKTMTEWYAQEGGLWHVIHAPNEWYDLTNNMYRVYVHHES